MRRAKAGIINAAAPTRSRPTPSLVSSAVQTSVATVLTIRGPLDTILQDILDVGGALTASGYGI